MDFQDFSEAYLKSRFCLLPYLQLTRSRQDLLTLITQDPINFNQSYKTSIKLRNRTLKNKHLNHLNHIQIEKIVPADIILNLQMSSITWKYFIISSIIALVAVKYLEYTDQPCDFRSRELANEYKWELNKLNERCGMLNESNINLYLETWYQVLINETKSTMLNSSSAFYVLYNGSTTYHKGYNKSNNIIYSDNLHVYNNSVFVTKIEIHSALESQGHLNVEVVTDTNSSTLVYAHVDYPERYNVTTDSTINIIGYGGLTEGKCTNYSFVSYNDVAVYTSCAGYSEVLVHYWIFEEL